MGSLSSTLPCGERHSPVDCELGSWMEWSGCSRRCGGGQQIRMRVVVQQASHGGKPCSADHGSSMPLQVTRSCNTDPCQGALVPQDCALGDWADWSRCVERDALGDNSRQIQRYRSREVITPGAFGGKPCDKALEEVAPCHVKAGDDPEPTESSQGGAVDCELAEWSPWTLCDKTCDSGQTIRSRKVKVPASGGGKPCGGETLQTMGCNEHPCTVDVEGRNCLLSPWGDWSSCSSQCGEGIEKRVRTVLAGASPGGLGCNGLTEEARSCQDIEPCTQRDCQWGNWLQWGDCSKTCGGGHRSRERHIELHPTSGGKACESLGSINELEACGGEPCDVEECVDGQWDSWESWGACSRSCGKGVQWRHRKVKLEASPCGKTAEGNATEVRHCDVGPCEEDKDCQLSSWTQWSGCSASCDGVQSRTRRISQPGSGSGKFCAGNAAAESSGAALREVPSCNGPDDLLAQKDAPGFSDIIQACGFGEKVDCALGKWSSWSDCSRTCDSGQRSRNRTISKPAANGGKPCDGPMDEIDVCGIEPCKAPIDCEWHDWEDWGACSRCDGERHRSRTVATFGNARGKPCSAGASKEAQQCNECPKMKTFWCIWDDWTTGGTCSTTCGHGGVQKRSRQLKATEVAPRMAVNHSTSEAAASSATAVGSVTGVNATCSGSEVSFETCTDQPPCGEQCKPKHCKFTDWSDWSSSSCDGLCHRKRAVEHEANECGRPCAGELSSTKACPNDTCDAEQDCARGDWSSWTECTSAQGQRLRRRKIEQDAGPLGHACEGSVAATEPCAHLNATESTVDCRLSEWSSWTDCSRTCGGGSQERSRKVISHAADGGSPCKGSLRTVQACGVEPCPADDFDVDCRLASWSDWNGCTDTESVQDAGSQAFRTRSIVPAKGRGRQCEGATKEAGVCPNQEKADCTFAEWAPWGECGRSCGGGQRFRTRELLSEAKHGGSPCEGSVSESEPCNEKPCDADKDCLPSEWSAWSVCTEQCDQGHQVRERSIEKAANIDGAGCSMGLLEVRGCLGPGLDGEGGDCHNSTDCEWGEWREWGACQPATLCGMGFRSRMREVAVQPSGKGKLCNPLAKEEVRPDESCPGSCELPPQDCIDGAWGDWAEWGACSATCGGGGTQMRKREVAVRPNKCGRAAQGNAEEFRLCDSTEDCDDESHDCVFEDWGPWTPRECSAPCNGARNRTRSIAKPSTESGKPCSGPIIEIVRCNPGPGEAPPWGCDSGAPVDCVQVDWSEWSDCSVPCGVGNQTRSREVIQPPAFGGRSCESPLQELRECRAKACASMDCRMSVWEDWGGCDTRLGQRVRRRHVVQKKVGGGLDCEGPRSEVSACDRKCQDKQYFCGWADWAPWSSCSESCGTSGRVVRKRELKVSGEVPQEDRRGAASAESGSMLKSANSSLVNSRLDAANDSSTALAAKYAVLHREIALATIRRRWSLAAAFAGGGLSLVLVLGTGALMSRSRHIRGGSVALLQDSDSPMSDGGPGSPMGVSLRSMFRP